jgi:hypothetical protein
MGDESASHATWWSFSGVRDGAAFEPNAAIAPDDRGVPAATAHRLRVMGLLDPMDLDALISQAWVLPRCRGAAFGTLPAADAVTRVTAGGVLERSRSSWQSKVIAY